MKLRHFTAAYLLLGVLVEAQGYVQYVPHTEFVAYEGHGFERLVIYFAALWPARLLKIPLASPWTGVALMFPIVAWGLLGLAFLFWIERRAAPASEPKSTSSH